MRTVAILFFAACCLACAGGMPPAGNRQTTIENKQEIVRVSIAELVEEDGRTDEEIVAKYKDKSVLISGRVFSTFNKTNLPTLAVWDGRKGILCTFMEQERARVSGYRVGDDISVVGNVFLGSGGKGISFFNCTVSP